MNYDNAILNLAANYRAAEIRGNARDGNSPVEPRTPLLTMITPSGMESLITKKVPQKISLRRIAK